MAFPGASERNIVRFSLGLIVSGSPLCAATAELVAQAFAPRSARRGATLFAPVSPAVSGVITENRYADPRMWTERYHEFGVGAIGTGVAIGDYDGDSRPDLFIVSKTESCRLFRNLGDWRFEDVTEKAGVADLGAAAAEWKQGATFADVNNDGRLDLYVCRFAAPNLLYVNQGDGTFKEEGAVRGLAIVDASSMAAFHDYDRDGSLDVYLQTNLLNASASPTGQRDYLFHNRGDGTFENVTAQAGIRGATQGHSATWWDYDADGWPDLYVANDFAPPDVLYHNNRDGTFRDVTRAVLPHTPFSSMGADLGDVNNDGRIDFLVADMAATAPQKDRRGMADSRVRGSTATHDAGAPQFQRNALFLATGTPVMLEAASLAGLAATDWTWSVRFEDLDNDGRLDLHVTNGMNREQHNSDLISRIMSAETPTARVQAMRASPVLNEANLAFRSATGDSGALEFENIGPGWGLDQKGVSFGAAFGDLDGDGDLDLVFANYQAGATLLRNDSDSGHRLTIALRGTASNRFGVGSTVEVETAGGKQVRQLVLARGYLSSSEPALHFGLGGHDRIESLRVIWPSGETQSFTDLAADRRYTVAEPSSPDANAKRSPGAMSPSASSPRPFDEIGRRLNFSITVREEPVDEFVAQPLLPARLGTRGPALAVGDLNGDGADDLVLGGTAVDPARILGATGDRSFASVALPKGGTVGDGPVLIFDANADGKNDLLLTKAGNVLPAGAPDYQPRVFLTGSDGALMPAPSNFLPPLPLSVGAVAAADFDRDGRLDVFLGARVLPQQYPFAPASALLANRAGGFENVTDALAPGLRNGGMVTSALWSDVDGDGWIDLLIALDWGGIRYWRNDRGRAFADESDSTGFSAAGNGWWTSLASADFNRDGRPDYVAGNVGLNTPYRATPAEPALLFVVEPDEGAHLIEARYDGDRVVPWRTRKELGARIPSIVKRFPRNDVFARSSLEEIVGAAPLAAAKRLPATEFRSGVFLSAPNGKYRFAPLPRLAQISPLQGVVAGDFDGDGHADICVVQNSHAPARAVGRFDGGIGQFLRGDGRGGFVAVPAEESAWVVTGDAKALAVFDYNADGWPDFLVTRNGGSTLAFENHARSERHSLAVRLHDRGGNPSAIGARVTLKLADRSEQTAEIFAGSGWASQSSATCFFGYVNGTPPAEIRVRWPDNTSSTHAVPSATRTVVLTKPDR